ncbi:MAG TPA: biosynthetic peptidoglycan transglycosylase, partial [Chthoniobacteraceae bacterium]|nr:biosynthetic peptidoglycan transglycosylase [Chthoniobacteraceae bacterium]
MPRLRRLNPVRLWRGAPGWARLGAKTLCALVVIGAAWFAWFLYWAPLPRGIADPAPLTTVYLDAKGRLVAEIAGPEARSHRPVPLAQMGPWMPAAMVEMEDRRFYSHPGVDALGTARALLERRGGGSTITQQYVKIATGRKGRGILSKIREAFLALQLERRWPKEKILEAYLNRVPFGNRLIGVEAASEAYFDKPAQSLTKAEAIFLAGLPREPSLLNPWSHADAARLRFDGARRLLVARGFLGAQEGDEMLPPAVGRHLPVNDAPNFISIAAARARRTGIVRVTL